MMATIVVILVVSWPYSFVAASLLAPLVIFFAGSRSMLQAASPGRLLSYVWLPTTGLSLLRLSGLERPLRGTTALALGVAAGSLLVGLLLGRPRAGLTRIARLNFQPVWHPMRAIVGLYGVLCIAALTDLYVIKTHGMVPLLSPTPDAARFLLAEALGGLTETAAGSARLSLMLVIVLFASQRARLTRAQWWAAIAVVPLSVGLIALWIGRGNLMISLIVGGLAYTLARGLSRRWVVLSFAIVAIPLIVVVPILREKVSYGDDYLQNLTEFHSGVGALRYPYAATVYNLQTFQEVLRYYPAEGTFHGALMATGVAKIAHLPVDFPDLPWERLFANFWITSTALSTFWADFGIAGLVILPFLVGLLSARWYGWLCDPMKTVSELGLTLYSYWVFVLIFTVYVWYPARPEIYMDFLSFAAFHWWARERTTTPSLAAHV